MTPEALIPALDHLAETLAASPEQATAELDDLRGRLRAALESRRHRMVRYFERRIRERPGSAMAKTYREMIARISPPAEPQSTR